MSMNRSGTDRGSRGSGAEEWARPIDVACTSRTRPSPRSSYAVIVGALLTALLACAPCQAAEMHDEHSEPIRFHGHVMMRNGSPAVGAVVVSAHGGMGVSHQDGSFEIDVVLPADIEEIPFTAVATIGGVTLSAQWMQHRADVSVDSKHRLVAFQGSTDCASEWLPLFGQRPGLDGANVRALAIFDDGTGPALFAGGDFTVAGGVLASYIAKWDGERWSTLGTGMSAPVRSLVVFDDGSGNGPALYAGGFFATAGGVTVNNIARWNGAAWSSLGTGVSPQSSGVFALAVYDDGTGGGPALFAGGQFSAAGGVAVGRIAKWNGSVWSKLTTGVGLASQFATVHALLPVDEGSAITPGLYVAGAFTLAGGAPAANIARWGDGAWTPLGAGTDSGISSIALYDDGSGRGPRIVVGGGFMNAGASPALRIAQWDGTSWSPLGIGMDSSVNSLCVHDEGNGRNPVLVAGGGFVLAGGVSATRIAQWNGVSWAPLGPGLDTLGNTFVYALVSGNIGPDGPSLFAGGAFTYADTLALNRIGRWNGTAWSELGESLKDHVHALAVFDDGDGPALYVAGAFESAAGIPLGRIARWTGHEWSSVGGGVSGGLGLNSIEALEVYDDGTGRRSSPAETSWPRAECLRIESPSGTARPGRRSVQE